MKTIIAYSVSRSDLYRFQPILNEINKNKKIDLKVVASHVHYMRLFGNTFKEFENKLYIEERKKIKVLKDNPNSIVNKLSDELNFFSNLIKKKNPDLVLVLGDRYEMLAPVIASIPFNVPVAHIYGGAVTVGAIDELVRHSMTKMSHLHLTAHKNYSNRIKKMGEEIWRIKTIGMPDLKVLKNQKKMTTKEIFTLLGLNLKKKTLLVTLHPTVREEINLEKQINNLFKAIKTSDHQAIFTYPNSDLGYEYIIKKIKKLCKKNKKFKLIKFSSKILYANLLRNCVCMIGNSSSGIVEAASFKLPVVNLGIRQSGKEKPKNVINSDFKFKNILKSIQKGSSKKFQSRLTTLKNPYESSLSMKSICNFITRKYDKKKLLLKKFV